MNATQPPCRTVKVEVKVRGKWIFIDEELSLADHERNARLVGATAMRTLDGKQHFFFNKRK